MVTALAEACEFEGALMDFSSQQQWINALWFLFGLYWIVSAFKLKKTKKRESWGQRFRYVLPLAAAFYLFRPRAHYGWLGIRFVPASDAAAWIGVVLTAAGVAIAIWARWHLGTNWSGVVTLKEGHELIRSGPYRTIRHPIYTGILLAFLGTAVALGEMRGLLAVAIAWLSFYTKARHEESFLNQEFGDRFAEHSRHTGMFLPHFS
jgi:protein-S-isoprenylcysteine O-methyltransferase Ste14